MNEADRFLAGDRVLARLIADYGGPLPEEPRPRREVYAALLRSITSQQLSTKAADAIHARLIARFGGASPTPSQLLADDPEELRAAAGLSRAKVVTLRSLAEHILDGELQLAKLTELPDEEVIRELVAVKGIGEWTAHMFLMFTLQRPDVLPVGDQGIRNAVKRAYGLNDPPKPDVLTALAERWRPYRTRACEYLWRSLDNAPI